MEVSNKAQAEVPQALLRKPGHLFHDALISDVCRDNGFNAAASQLEIMCKIAVATISIPIVLSLMEMINKCIK
jgi:stage III sporulation protein AD